MAVSFGYPDVLVGKEHIEILLGEDKANSLEYRDDSEDIIRWHNYAGSLDRIVETSSLFKLMGIDIEIVDINPSRDCEEILDLNKPVSEDFYDKYDLVLDLGTSEHCFNIGQAVKNAAEMVNLGGIVIHVTPLSMFNHGFFNINPTAYYDFYSQNGFEILLQKGMSGKIFDYDIFDTPSVQRFNNVPNDALNICVAQKLRKVPIKWPIQSKYLANPDLKSKG